MGNQINKPHWWSLKLKRWTCLVWEMAPQNVLHQVVMVKAMTEFKGPDINLMTNYIEIYN